MGLTKKFFLAFLYMYYFTTARKEFLFKKVNYLKNNYFQVFKQNNLIFINTRTLPVFNYFYKAKTVNLIKPHGFEKVPLKICLWKVPRKQMLSRDENK